MQNDNGNRTDIVATAQAPFPSSTAAHYSVEYEESAHLRDHWHVLKKRKWWALGTAAGVIIATILVILFMPPIWEGKITLQITQDNGSTLLTNTSGMDPLGQMMGSSDLDRFYETQYAILKSPTLAYGLIDTLNLQEHPSYKKIVRENPDDPPDVIRQKYAEYLLDHLTVSPVRNSYLVDVIYHSKDKALAQKIPETIQKEYIELCMKTRQQSFAMLRDWLDEELVRLGKKLETSEQNTIADGQKGDFLGIDLNDQSAQLNVVLQKYVQVGGLLTQCQSDRAVKEALYKQIKEKGADAPVIVNNPLIQGLRQQLIALQGQATGTGEVLGPKFPDRKVTVSTAKEISQKLNNEVKRLETSIKADYDTALKAENLLQQEFNGAKAKMVDMENGLVNFHMLKRDLETNQALYEGLLGRMKDASVAATMVSSNVAVITAPELPYKPWLPKPWLFLALSVILGVMLGIGTAFFLEYLDSSIKTAEEIEKVGHIPSLGMIPMLDNGALPESTSQHLETITHFQPRSQISEAISHIRSAIMLSTSTSPPQVIVVTSSNPGEGKTTSTSNIAIGLSGGERKVLLVDCDLRKPRLHRALGVSNRRGLTNYLTGGSSLEELIKPTEVPCLDFLPAGPTPPNPNDLLSSSAFSKMLAILRQNYRHIVIDSPPVIGFADARTLSVLSDGVVLVFKHHSTTREAARLAVQMLVQNNSQILGGILTMVRKDRMGYGAYYGYYKYYHKYYKSYGDSTEDKKDNSPKKLT